MSEFNAQLEWLEPLRVAAVSVTSESPEGDSINTLLEWARPQGLLDGAFHLFGYDNCQPYPNHTYTTWLTVSQDVKPYGDIEIQDFSGGLFAVTEIQGVEQISPRWKQLAQWCREQHYKLAEQHGLEECLDALSNRPQSDWRFKLYLPLQG